VNCLTLHSVITQALVSASQVDLVGHEVHLLPYVSFVMMHRLTENDVVEEPLHVHVIHEVCGANLRVIEWQHEVVRLEVLNLIMEVRNHRRVLSRVLWVLHPNIAEVTLHGNGCDTFICCPGRRTSHVISDEQQPIKRLVMTWDVGLTA